MFTIQLSVSDLSGSLGWRIRLRETVLGHYPRKPDNAWFEATRVFPVGNHAAQSSLPVRAVVECGYTSVEVMQASPADWKMSAEADRSMTVAWRGSR